MNSFRVRLLFLLLLAAALVISSCQQLPYGRVNLAHLDSLCEDVTIAGLPCTIVHIYSDAPDYLWTDASGEGVACVDDVARAAVLYIHAGGAAGARPDTVRIRRLLNFVMVMQAEDGTFNNFIEKDLTINREGPTSRSSFGFWAARGYWALAEGYAFFKVRDPGYAAELRRAFLRCRQPLDLLMQKYGAYETVAGGLYPAWLLGGYGADATSEFLLGASAWLAVEQDSLLAGQAARLAEGIAAMQVDAAKAEGHDPRAFADPQLQGAFLSWPGLWHAWGSAQIQALAGLAIATGDKDWLPPAAQGARFLVKLLAGHWLHEYDLSTGKASAFSQIAYDIRTTALGFLQLYRATGDENYAILAGLAASWLTGNNIEDQPLYDPATGRCFDGIDRDGLNRNSGAESTIEALYTLVEIEKVPAAAAWLYARSPEKWGDRCWQARQDLRRSFRATQGTIILTWRADSGDFVIQQLDDQAVQRLGNQE
jgi:hypothetical protein